MAKSTYDRVLPFPPRVPPAPVTARQAVKNLARFRVITKAEAVRSLEEVGATSEEIDLVRAIYSVRRRRI